MYIILKEIPQIIILVDHLIEFLPRIKYRYPHSVKSHINIKFVSQKTKTTYGNFSFHSNILIYQAVKHSFSITNISFIQLINCSYAAFSYEVPLLLSGIRSNANLQSEGTFVCAIIEFRCSNWSDWQFVWQFQTYFAKVWNRFHF